MIVFIEKNKMIVFIWKNLDLSYNLQLSGRKTPIFPHPTRWNPKIDFNKEKYH